MQVQLSPEARSAATEAFRGAQRPRVAISPGASQATKRWPPERFAEVARAVADAGATVVLAGGPADRPALRAFSAACSVPVAADLTALRVDALAAALSEVDLLVACDSGPVHLASAVGTPALAIFGPTSPERWGPKAPGRVVSLSLPCAPCSNHGGDRCPKGHHRCMVDLAPEAVIKVALEMLASRREP
jgi:heptosyltransferase-2